jgi:hypothetical protein
MSYTEPGGSLARNKSAHRSWGFDAKILFEESGLMSEVYRLNVSTMGVLGQGDARPVIIPAGSTIIIPNGFVDGDAFIECIWGEAKVAVLAMDVREHGTPVATAES